MIIAWNRKRAGIAPAAVGILGLLTVHPSGGATPASPAETRVTQEVLVAAQQAGTTRATQQLTVPLQQAGTTRVSQEFLAPLQQAGTTRVTQTFAVFIYTVEPPGIGSGDCPLAASYTANFVCVHAASVSTIALVGSYVTAHTAADGSYVTSIGLLGHADSSVTCVHGMFGDKC